MAAVGVSCRAFVVLRLDITRALSVASLTAPRKYRNETTQCGRTISHRGLSTTRRHLAPTLTPILNKDSKTEYRDARIRNKEPTSSETRTANVVPDSTTLAQHDVIVEYHRGLPRITVPLPSRKERCIFTLKPITNTVADLIDMLKLEDRGIDRAVITKTDGTRIGGGNTIESLLEADFVLILNDVSYRVSPPNQQAYSVQDMEKLSDVKAVIGQLYETLNCQEYNSILEREVMAQLEEVMLELEPLEVKRQELEAAAERRANIQPWLGLVAMAVQFGILARLTWWEYSWDIMEPVTYFVTYGTGMICYIYFILTRQEYMLPDVLNRRYLVVLHKRARKMGLDLTRYNTLKEQAYELETTLKIIRGPLWKQKNLIEEKRRERSRSTSSSSSSSRSPSSSPSPTPSPKRNGRPS